MPILTAPSNVRPTQYLYLEDVDWSHYEKMLEMIGYGSMRVTFDRGKMEVMSPLPEHETERQLLGQLVEILAIERNIPMPRLGSMTIRRQDLEWGLEPDNCYSIRSEPQVRFKTSFDFTRDPAPDLVIEIDVTRRSIPKMPIYAALGVRELWIYGLSGLSFRLLEDGRYRPVDVSEVFPGIAVTDLARFISLWPTTPETALLRSFRDWVRDSA